LAIKFHSFQNKPTLQRWESVREAVINHNKSSVFNSFSDDNEYFVEHTNQNLTL